MMRSFESRGRGTGREQPLLEKCAAMQGEGGHRIRYVQFHPGSRPRRFPFPAASPCTSCRWFPVDRETFPRNCTTGGTLPESGGTSLSGGQRVGGWFRETL